MYAACGIFSKVSASAQLLSETTMEGTFENACLSGSSPAKSIRASTSAHMPRTWEMRESEASRSLS